MRRFAFAFMCCLSLIFGSCSEDFDVAAPYKNINIVFAMLNAADTAHYVRIQKAFMDENKSAIDMAKVSDSNFYAPGVLDVQIKEISNGNVISTTAAERVDMANEGYTKESGMFFSSPNYAYKFKKTLNKNYTYRIVIRNTQTGDVDSGMTGIIPVDTTRGNFYVFDFGDPDLSFPPQPIGFSRTTSQSFQYKLLVQVPAPAKLLEGVIRFFYWEKNNNIGTEELKYVDFPFAKATVPDNGTAELKVHHLAFYEFFREALGVAPANVLRFLDSCDVYVYAGSKDFVDYQNITQVQLAGITSNEIKPIYTNIQGTDVYGLFTTRAVRIGRNIPIDGVTLDSLYLNPITAPTGLQPEPSDK